MNENNFEQQNQFNNMNNSVENNNSFYDNCGSYENNGQILNDISGNSNIDDNKKANKLCVWALLCYFVFSPLFRVLLIFPFMDSILGVFCSSFSFMSSLAAYVLVIIARVKFPDNKFAKILMWIFILLFILSIILFAVMMISCAIACNQTDFSGCG